jgi:hypothetical protein
MMLELKEHVFAHLNELGLEEVQARLARGERLGDPQLVREWLELPVSERSQTPVASAISARQRA